MSTKQRRPLFERLSHGLEDGIAHARGELTLRTTTVPAEPPGFDGQTIAAMRRRAGMSQAIFAGLLNVSIKTLQSWEQGARRPSDASRRLLQLFTEYPEVLCRLAGVREIPLREVPTKRISRGGREVVGES